jgi:hypothetical protein
MNWQPQPPREVDPGTDRSDLLAKIDRVIRTAVADALESVVNKPTANEERRVLRHEISQVTQAIQKHDAFRNLTDQLLAWLSEQAQVERARYLEEVSTCRHRWDRSEANLNESAGLYEKAIEEWMALDEMTKRMRSWASDIERILPMPEGRRSEFTFDQVVRSRGLVMAALAGMTSVGSPPPKEDGK